MSSFVLPDPGMGGHLIPHKACCWNSLYSFKCYPPFMPSYTTFNLCTIHPVPISMTSLWMNVPYCVCSGRPCSQASTWHFYPTPMENERGYALVMSMFKQHSGIERIFLYPLPLQCRKLLATHLAMSFVEDIYGSQCLRMSFSHTSVPQFLSVIASIRPPKCIPPEDKVQAVLWWGGWEGEWASFEIKTVFWFFPPVPFVFIHPSCALSCSWHLGIRPARAGFVGRHCSRRWGWNVHPLTRLWVIVFECS